MKELSLAHRIYMIAGLGFMVALQVAAIANWDMGYKIFVAWFLFAILHTLLRIEDHEPTE